ncbi:MAG: hypothetical protein LBH53_02385 [Puniceicoccales bacterium]|jgi:hypothetical protein|nr:hypothetical protein [Puniceicoccales bacterium]
MAGWKKLRVKDLEDHMVPDQLKNLLEAAAGRDGTDPLPKLLESVLAQVRAAIRTGRTAPLSADGEKVPEELWSDGCALLLEKLQGRLPALRLTADQVRAAETARLRLRRVERGELQVSCPTDPSPSQGIPIRCLHFRPHPIRSSQLEGL